MNDGIDRDAVLDDIRKLLLQGWPEPVITGFMLAKLRDEPWREARRIIDELGQQVHQGDLVKKARIDHFNDMLIDELKKRQAQ